MKFEREEIAALQTAKHTAEMRKRVENDMLEQIMQQEASVNQSSILSESGLEQSEAIGE